MTTLKQEDLVSSVMTTVVKTTLESTSLGEVVRTMLQNDLGNLVVMDEGRPVGIVTERDIVRLLAVGRYSPELKVGEIMSHPLETVSPDDSIKRTFILMDSRKIRRIPVVENGDLVGIVGGRDIIHWALRSGHLKLDEDQISSEDLQRIFLEW